MTSQQSKLGYHATFGMDDCRGCGTHLAYQLNIGREEVECPHCHTVHEIIRGGKLKLKES